ncbi:MALR1 protein, partial [Eolophus roseicapillus]|nr:MALR1 protein [Eolophus roseicapilla]
MFILKNSSSISQIAQLRSPQFRQTGSNCTLSFWYYNYGHSVGAAEMQLLVNGLKQHTVLWRAYYNEGDQWLKAVIQLGRLPHPFQFSLDKISLGVYDGVSAIDDITFENCALPPAALSCEGPNYFWCRRTKACIDSLLVCDLVDNCGDGSDEENCSKKLINDFFEKAFFRPHSSLPISEGGFFGCCFFLFIGDCSNRRRGFFFKLFFRKFRLDIREKFFFFRVVFFWNTLPKDVVNAPFFGVFFFRLDRNVGNMVLCDVSLPMAGILVKGTVGDGFTGDIGLDDMSFLGCTLYNGKNRNLPTVSTTTPGTSVPATLPMNNCTEKDFVCRASGRCIQMIQKCDFRPDCSDKSDELACVMEFCDFEDKNQCGWYQPTLEQTSGSNSIHTTNIFKWEHGRGTDLYPGQEKHCPLIDHTT